MMKRSDFIRLGGFNEHYNKHYQDTDLCFKVINDGQRIIFTPHAILYHHESLLGLSPESYYDFVDRTLLLDQWQDRIDQGDPYYNPNFESREYAANRNGYILKI